MQDSYHRLKAEEILREIADQDLTSAAENARAQTALVHAILSKK